MVPNSADVTFNLPGEPPGGIIAPINILIVDDEPGNLTVLETLLDNPSYRLVRAGSADEACWRWWPISTRC